MYELKSKSIYLPISPPISFTIFSRLINPMYKRQNNDTSLPKMSIGLKPRVCKYVTLLGKRDFTDVIRLKIFWWENYLGLSTWDQCNHKDLYKRNVRGSDLEKVMWWWKQTLECCHCWKGVMSQGIGGQPLETGKGKEPWEGIESGQHLDFSPVRPISRLLTFKN